MPDEQTTRSDSGSQGRILNHPWEDVADDVTSAIEKAVQPLLKRAVDDIYGGLLDTTQDYLKDNLAFNIASRIAAAEREAHDARRKVSHMIETLRPFAAVAQNDIGDDEADTDLFRPMSSHNRAPLLTVGDMRQAWAAFVNAGGTLTTKDTPHAS